MKAVHILYDCIIEKKVYELLKKAEIDRFAQIDNLKCEWRKDLRHMDSSTWPGTDSMIMIFLEDSEAVIFTEKFKKFKEELEENVPLFAAIVNVDQII